MMTNNADVGLLTANKRQLVTTVTACVVHSFTPTCFCSFNTNTQSMRQGVIGHDRTADLIFAVTGVPYHGLADLILELTYTNIV